MANETLSPQALAIEEEFREIRAGDDGQFDLFLQRQNTVDACEKTGIPGRCKFEHGEVAGVPIIRIIPENDECQFTSIFLHGGAFCLMSAWTHHRMAGHIAEACCNQVIVPDYSLAPEHPFPKALEECVSVASALTQAEDGRPVALTGDSAGGGLALSTLFRLRDLGIPPPFAAVLMAPWLDLTLSLPSIKTAARSDVILTEINLRAYASLYAGDACLANPLVSPLFGSFSGLPPIYVQSSGKDLLRDESKRLQEVCVKQGIEIRHDCYSGMLHSFQFFAGRMPEADEAIMQCAEFLHETLADAGSRHTSGC